VLVVVVPVSVGVTGVVGSVVVAPGVVLVCTP
jgi:hypothetical protein